MCQAQPCVTTQRWQAMPRSHTNNRNLRALFAFGVRLCLCNESRSQLSKAKNGVRQLPEIRSGPSTQPAKHSAVGPRTGPLTAGRGQRREGGSERGGATPRKDGRTPRRFGRSPALQSVRRPDTHMSDEAARPPVPRACMGCPAPRSVRTCNSHCGLSRWVRLLPPFYKWGD